MERNAGERAENRLAVEGLVLDWAPRAGAVPGVNRDGLPADGLSRGALDSFNPAAQEPDSPDSHPTRRAASRLFCPSLSGVNDSLDVPSSPRLDRKFAHQAPPLV